MELEKVLTQIKNSSFYRKIEEKEQKNIVENRQSLAVQLENIGEEALSAAIEHRERIEKAESDIAKLQENLKQKKTELVKLKTEQYADANQFECREKDCQKALEDSADSKINEAIGIFHERRSQFMRASSEIILADVLAFIRTRVETLGLMKLEPVLDEKKFRKLISELPKILDAKWAQAS